MGDTGAADDTASVVSMARHSVVQLLPYWSVPTTAHSYSPLAMTFAARVYPAALSVTVYSLYVSASFTRRRSFVMLAPSTVVQLKSWGFVRSRNAPSAGLSEVVMLAYDDSSTQSDTLE